MGAVPVVCVKQSILMGKKVRIMTTEFYHGNVIIIVRQWHKMFRLTLNSVHGSKHHGFVCRTVLKASDIFFYYYLAQRYV